MKQKLISPICGLLLAIGCLIAICVRLFGDYPPSNFNYLLLGGLFAGAMLAAPLLDLKK